MKKHIFKYLTENYFLDKSQIGNAGIYSFDDTKEWKVPVKAKELIDEVVTLFGYSFTRTKWFIHDWCTKQKPDYCLKFYWTSHDIDFNAIRKWQASGLLDNFDSGKQSLAALYEGQAKQLLR
jgi:hypothetical protein